MEKRSITVPVQIRFGDVDMARHVHNSVYLHWFELARMELFRSFLPEEHDWMGQGILLARNEVDYRMPVMLTDEIHVETWCSAIGTKSIDLSYSVIRTGDRSGICAEGRSVLVCFDLNAGKSIEVPAEWRNVFEKLRKQ